MKKRNLLYAKRIFTLLLGFFLTMAPFIYSNAQILQIGPLHPKVDVYISHPPDLIIGVKKIAFGPATGNCSDEIVNAIISDFVKYKSIEVIDRENLKAILAEHSFTLTGSVDQTSAATIGKILGPSALVFVKVLRCTTQQDKLYDTERKYSSQTGQPYNQTVNISRTKAFLTVSIQVVDLISSKILAAQTFDYSPEKSNNSYTGSPEFPTTFEVQDLAIKSAVKDVHRIFLPWGEFKSVDFYDEKKYNMKEAYAALKSGNTNEAFLLISQGIEESKNDKKLRKEYSSRVYYDMGVCYMLKYNYDSALVYLSESRKFSSGDIVQKAIRICEDAKSLKSRTETVNRIASNEIKKQKEEDDKKIQAEVESTITNKSIIDMVALKLPESVILQKIKSSKCKFDTTPDALATLTKSGVSEKIMMAMIEKQ